MVKSLIEDCWRPYNLAEIYNIFEQAPFFWAIGGGYAIEIFTGEAFREHEDVDLLVWRDELPLVRSFLKNWDVYASDPPGTLRYWSDSENLGANVHDIWIRNINEQEWRFQLMVMDREQDLWLFRRDPELKRAIDEVIYYDKQNVPYLSPVYQLLFKAKNRRNKDEVDFTYCLPCLSAQEQQNLALLLKKVYSQNHPWLQRLENKMIAVE